MKLFKFSKVKSTNLTAIRFLKKYQPPFAVLSTVQSHGRGRNGKVFKSCKGGIYLTLVLKSKNSEVLKNQFKVALMIIDILAKRDVIAKIKWPNDVYLGNKKIGGILVKKIKNLLLIGIGLNINQKRFNKNLKKIATSIFIEKRIKLDLNSIVSDILKRVLLINKKFFFDVNKFNKNLLWVGKKVQLKNKNIVIEGIFNGIDQNGFAKIDNQKFLSGTLRLKSNS